MKLLTYRFEGTEHVGILSKDEKSVYETSWTSMNELIDSGVGIAELAESSADGRTLCLADVELLAPIPHPKQDVICLGINYADHAKESARYKKESFALNREHAIYFSKRVNEAVGHGAGVEAHDDIEERLDYEAELAVIIGKETRGVKGGEVWDHIFGYTVLNDVSARNLQTSHKQWYFGKSLDGFTPMGPWIVTEDEFDRPPALAISSKINGELRQDSRTDLLLTGIEEIVEELSSGMTLLPGTIIATGTPSGVGMGFEPPRFLKKGDVMTLEIEGIGVLENTIV